jgi:hypothetical protein
MVGDGALGLVIAGSSGGRTGSRRLERGLDILVKVRELVDGDPLDVSFERKAVTKSMFTEDLWLPQEAFIHG